MRACLTTACALLLPLACDLTAGQKDKKQGEPSPAYFPLKVGNTWEYRIGKDRVTVRVAGEETDGKDRVAVLETTRGDRTFTERISSKPDGIYRHAAEGERISPPLCLLPLPVKPGAAWEVKGSAGGLGFTGECMAGAEEVAVPAGKFTSVTASCPDFRIGRARLEVTYWFAPGIGPVKQRVKVGDRVEVMELVKFTPAK